jgi:hypothetical protein
VRNHLPHSAALTSGILQSSLLLCGIFRGITVLAVVDPVDYSASSATTGQLGNAAAGGGRDGAFALFPRTSLGRCLVTDQPNMLEAMSYMEHAPDSLLHDPTDGQMFFWLRDTQQAIIRRTADSSARAFKPEIATAGHPCCF